MGNSVLDSPVGDVIYLVRCALGAAVPDDGRIAAMDLDEVYRTATQHLLTSACATALEASGIRDTRFIQAKGKAVRKNVIMDTQRAELFRHMDVAGIWHVALKGCVLGELYPTYGMRQMADNDILFDARRADDVRNIMLSMGFSCESFDAGAHDVYYKKPVSNFELHRLLFEKLGNRRVWAYYQDPQRLLVSDGANTYGMHMRDEDFYVYLVAHEYKHFAAGGTGLRSLVDTYVCLRAKEDSLDWNYVSKQLDELGLTDFERDNRLLARALLTGTALTAEQEAMLAYMAESGTYGTMAHNISNQIATYGRWGYLVCRTLPPIESMSSIYPVLRSAPVLLPACWVLRLASALVTKPKTVAYQLRAAFVEPKG
ncbi:MAG: nucleotidyltransferase family protein [Atopobiaceae bacterium]|nr:nucleotidyltransferase family protein [Atopobiaceae bacterium]